MAEKEKEDNIETKVCPHCLKTICEVMIDGERRIADIINHGKKIETDGLNKYTFIKHTCEVPERLRPI